jgi:hypothetical protein
MRSLRWWMIGLLMIASIINMACQDLSGARRAADFDWFEYVERPCRVDPFAA